MQNIIKRVIRILVSGYIVKMIRNLIFKNSNDSNKNNHKEKYKKRNC